MIKIRLGIIGLHNHYHAYPFAKYLKQGIPEIEFVSVSDERKNFAEEFAKEFNAKSSYKDYLQMLDNETLDAVIITSYTSVHAEQVEECAKRKIHILLDKPISTTLEDAQRIVNAVKGNGVILLMAYLLRFLPPYLKMKELVDQGVIGKLTSAIYSIRIPAFFIKDSPNADNLGWYADPVKGGGGGFIDHGVHFTDWARWFFGKNAVDVNGRIASLNYTYLPVEDYGIATYRMEDGAIVTIESTWHAAEWYGPMTSPDRCTLTGTEGEIEFHYQKTPQIEISSRKEPYKGRVYFDWTGEDRYEICYRNLLVELADAIKKNRSPHPDATDGLKALEMVLGAYKSDKLNETVKLPLEKGK
jgi:predicted dehydrogenase